MISTTKFYRGVATVLTSTFPQHMWYGMAYTVTRLLAPWNIRQNTDYKVTRVMNHAKQLNLLLGLISRTGKDFPIPTRGYGVSLFTKTRPNGLILCSTHIPLAKVAVSYLAEGTSISMVAIAAEPGWANTIALWGSKKRLPAIRADQFVLQKAKTILQRGGTIVVMVDKKLGGVYSPNIFRLAEKLGSDVIYAETVLHQDKTVEVNFRESKWNRRPGHVQEQMNELYQNISSLLVKQYNSGYLSSPVHLPIS